MNEEAKKLGEAIVDLKEAVAKQPMIVRVLEFMNALAKKLGL